MRPANLVYADPPWTYRNRHAERKDGGKTRFGVGAIGQYPLLTTDELCRLPVRDIAAERSMCFMWATWPCLPDAIRVMEAWGYEYKTVAFVWLKTNRVNGEPFFGIGYYTKSNTECCLLGVRGRPFKVDDSISQILEGPCSVVHPRMAHSEKPAMVRDRIVALCGDVPRVELFSRHETPGWASYGFDTSGNDIREDLRHMAFLIDIEKRARGVA